MNVKGTARARGSDRRATTTMIARSGGLQVLQTFYFRSTLHRVLREHGDEAGDGERADGGNFRKRERDDGERSREDERHP